MYLPGGDPGGGRPRRCVLGPITVLGPWNGDEEKGNKPEPLLLPNRSESHARLPGAGLAWSAVDNGRRNLDAAVRELQCDDRFLIAGKRCPADEPCSAKREVLDLHGLRGLAGDDTPGGDLDREPIVLAAIEPPGDRR